jgi:DNA mismatch repair protein MutL
VGRVQTLPEHVINHIAAGEVIERPASVVKELVENALDAQAHSISIMIQGGGVEMIQVDDDGIGMDAADAAQCFQRHATSKLRDLTDLHTIRSMGFRGEALPSIAAVSHLEMVSRCADAVAGTRVVNDGGVLTAVEACGAPPGTSFRIRDLFYNTPARLKFLKSPATESSHITQHVIALALAAPEVHMALRLNGRVHTRAAATTALGDRLDMLFGTGFQEQLLDLDCRDADFHLQGLTSRATFHRATRRQQFFFVNGRPIQSRALSHALYEAYRTLLPRDRHPAAFLFLTVPPEDVDVNVHPAKREVRFRQERQLYDRLRRSLQQRLQASLIQAPALATPLALAPEGTATERSVPMMWQSPTPPSAPVLSPLSAAAPPIDTRSETLGFHAGYPAEGRAVLQGEPVGQLHDTYILVQYPSGVFIVDQHAAHERVVYERLVAKHQHGEIDVQQLLFPVVLDLGGTDPGWVEACLPRLADLGFTLEPFGGSTFRLYSAPALLAERDYAAALTDIIEVLRTPADDEAPAAPTAGVSSVLERSLTVMACHGALRAHQRLHGDAMRALLRDLAQTPRPFTCPHGRPVLLNVALTEIEKQFLRR